MRRQILWVLISFFVGIGSAILLPRAIRAAGDKLLFPERRTQVERLTSPDGTVDAIVEQIDCGAPCSSAYAVSIVPKGSSGPRDAAQRVVLADNTVNFQARWKEDHLLEIAYDKAFIHNFQNVTYPLGRPGKPGSWQYAVEVHLSPSSNRFSYLTGRDIGGLTHP